MKLSEPWNYVSYVPFAYFWHLRVFSSTPIQPPSWAVPVGEDNHDENYFKGPLLYLLTWELRPAERAGGEDENKSPSNLQSHSTAFTPNDDDARWWFSVRLKLLFFWPFLRLRLFIPTVCHAYVSFSLYYRCHHRITNKRSNRDLIAPKSDAGRWDGDIPRITVPCYLSTWTGMDTITIDFWKVISNFWESSNCFYCGTL